MSAFKKNARKPKSLQFDDQPLRNPQSPKEQIIRKGSIGAIEEILQCGICLDKLKDPRMLPCQHTFCLVCLQTHLVAKTTPLTTEAPSTEQIRTSLSATIKRFINCPLCQKEIVLLNGMNSIDELPINLYLQSVLGVVYGSGSSSLECCSKCNTNNDAEICEHCEKLFCATCSHQHSSELNSNAHNLIHQLEETENRLLHKSNDFNNRCNQLTDKIKNAVQSKIEQLQRTEAEILGTMTAVRESGKTSSNNINNGIQNLKAQLQSGFHDDKLHSRFSKIVTEVHHYGEARLIFDPETLKLDQVTEGIYNDEITKEPKIDSDYKSRTLAPKVVWKKCPRPAGVGIPPWDTTKLYIAATDSRNILILDRNKLKLVKNLNHPEMVCPFNLVFCKDRRMIYVTDKWKHCVHVFSADNAYVKSLCLDILRSPEGLVLNQVGNLIICDTGNDRLVVVNPDSGRIITYVGVKNGVSQLNRPAGVAMFEDQLILADSGNHRIKIFNARWELVKEIGSLGRNRGEFRSAEVVAVDPRGFVLVGDAGNARVQVFKFDGTLVKIFGRKEGFKWISGICVTPEFDIITTDVKSRTLVMF